MSMLSARRIGRVATLAAGLGWVMPATRADAGAMYAVSGYQPPPATPVNNPATGQPITNYVSSPSGTIAFGDWSSFGNAQVIKDGKIYDTGRAAEYWDRPYSIANAVNDAGVVVGVEHSTLRWNRAFVSAPGPDGVYHPVALGANGGSISAATGINNAGTVIGWSDVAGQWKNHAFIDRPENDIGTLGGQNSMPTAINEKGQVIGWSNIATDWKAPANPNSYYTPEPTHAFLYQDGKMIDLGTLAGDKDSIANAINASGQIVGSSSNTAMTNYTSSDLGHAVLFDPTSGTPIDLNSLLAPNSGWVLNDATKITDSGQILGSGTYNGQAAQFILTPQAVPEPASLAVFGLIAAAGAVARRCKRV